jgi:hypothetical protein
MQNECRTTCTITKKLILVKMIATDLGEIQAINKFIGLMCFFLLKSASKNILTMYLFQSHTFAPTHVQVCNKPI